MTLDCNKTSLRVGATGETVKTAQTMLQTLGYYNGKIDGYYGSVTSKAVKKFQKDTYHSQDGWLGSKTCKSLNEKYNAKVQTTSNSSKNSSSSSSSSSSTKQAFKLDKDSPVTPSLTIFDEVVTLPGTPKSNAKNLKKSVITDFIDWSMNRDAEGLTHEATVILVHSYEKLGKIREYQKIELTIKNGSTVLPDFTLKGYINNIKITHEDDLWRMELSLVNYVEFLNMSVEDYNQTLKRSEHCKKLINLCGLKADIDFSKFNDDTCTISAQAKSENNETTSSGTSNNGATKTLEEVYQIASTFKYGGIGTGLSPEKAWKAYENGGRTFDCYDCSNFLFYCLKNFCKIPCRIVQGYSPYSGSRTHRVVQIKTNGTWACPKQAWNLTKNLRPFTPENKYALNALLTWEG